MRSSTRATLLDRFAKATGRTDCSEVVVIERRERWVLAVTASLGAGVMVLLRMFFDLSIIIQGAIAGVLVAIALTFLVTGHWLGRCGDTVILVRAARTMKGPHEMIGEWSHPVEATVDSGILTKRVTLAGESYVMATSMVQEFRSITGAT